MQTRFTYEELTPLEQCIADFMAAQALAKARRETKAEHKKEARKN